MVKRGFEVRIPEEAKVHGDRVVDQHYYDGKNHRTIIGWVSRDGFMYPNAQYFERYQEHWKQQDSYRCDMAHRNSVSVGLMALTLGIGYATGVYPMLVSLYGDQVANGIMDYCMYCIQPQPEETNTMEAGMRGNLMFSLQPCSTVWYRHMFDEKMNKTNADRFHQTWLEYCLGLGIAEVYISFNRVNKGKKGNSGDSCSDGGSDDISDKEEDFTETADSGHRSSEECLSMIWVVCASGEHKGLPLTYFLTERDVLSCSALKTVLDLLEKYGLQAKEVFMDRDSLTGEVAEMLQNLKIDYFAQMAADSPSIRTMLAMRGSEIRGNLRYALGRDYMFGTSRKDETLFASYKAKGTAVLLYNSMEGAKGANDLLKAVQKEARRLDNALKSGMQQSVKEEYKEFISIENGTAVIDFHALQGAYLAEGYKGICTGTYKPTETVAAISELQEASAKEFAESCRKLELYKSMEQQNVHGLFSRSFVCFIAAILRCEIENACRECGLDAKEAIDSLSEIVFAYAGTRYEYRGAIAKKWLPLFGKFNINDESIQSLGPLMEGLCDIEEGKPSVPAVREFKKKPGRGRPKKKTVKSAAAGPYTGEVIAGYFI